MGITSQLKKEMDKINARWSPPAMAKPSKSMFSPNWKPKWRNGQIEYAMTITEEGQTDPAGVLDQMRTILKKIGFTKTTGMVKVGKNMSQEHWDTSDKAYVAQIDYMKTPYGGKYLILSATDIEANKKAVRKKLAGTPVYDSQFGFIDFMEMVNEATCGVCGHNPAMKGKKVCKNCEEELEAQKDKKAEKKNKGTKFDKKKNPKNVTIDVDKLKPER